MSTSPNDIRTEQDRCQDFDMATAKAQTVLKDPEIVSQLGSMAHRLHEIAGNMFLPVIENGIITLEPERLLTNDIALIPYMETDPDCGLSLHGSMLTPTQNRFDTVTQLYAQEYDVSLRRAEKIGVELIKMTHGTDESFETPTNVTYGLLETRVMADPKTGMAFRTRPIMYLGAGMAHTSAYHVGATVAHEATHGIDMERSTTVTAYSDAFRAKTELRGYRVASVIRTVGGVLIEGSKTQLVEALRLQYATAKNPYPSSLNVISEMKQLGVIQNK